MLDGRFKANIEKGLRPIGTNLRKTGITADHLTALGVVMAAGAAVAIAMGQLRLGLLLLILDRPARHARRRRRQGLRHRVATRRLLRLGVRPRRPTRCCSAASPGTWPARIRATSSLLPMAVLAASLIISYQRAKAESLGFDAKGGIMERAERIILLGLRPAVRLAARRRCSGSCSCSRSSPRCSAS